MHKAIFLDKDGTLLHDLPYNVNPSLITWQQDVFDALKMLAEKGYLLVIITNQSGVARGLFEEKDLLTLEKAMRNTLSEHGISLAGFYYCPHHLDGKIKKYTFDCDCRKPKPGMLLQAAKDLKIDLSASWMIGDTQSDVEAGNKAGCKTILIGDKIMSKANPTYLVSTIKEAAKLPN